MVKIFYYIGLGSRGGVGAVASNLKYIYEHVHMGPLGCRYEFLVRSIINLLLCKDARRIVNTIVINTSLPT